MTWDQLERGERLTIHNATKEQLKWMYKDKARQCTELYKEVQRVREITDKMALFCGNILEAVYSLGITKEQLTAKMHEVEGATQ